MGSNAAGGVRNVTWRNNYHNHPVTNMSAIPKIRNMVLSNWVMTTVGALAFWTIAESPIENLTMRNITLTAAEPHSGWACYGYSGNKMIGSHVYASGTVDQVTPPLGHCNFSSGTLENDSE